MFEIELNYFISHQDELVAKHRGKTLVLRDQAVVGVFGTSLEAYLEARARYPLGTFMIQPCEPGPEAYTVTVSPHVTVEV